MHDDDETPAEQMVRELGIAPALGVDDNPLLHQARKNVESTVRHAHDMKADDDDPPASP